MITYLLKHVHLIVFLVFFSASNLVTAQTTGTITLGEATGAATTATTPTSPIHGATYAHKHQTIYTKEEILAAGGAAGPITSLAWRVRTSSNGYNNITIKIGHTTSTSLSSHNSDATNTVFTSAARNFTTGYDVLAFSTPFQWNGTSNVIVEICYTRDSTLGGSNQGQVFMYSATSPGTRYRTSSGVDLTHCTKTTSFTGFNSKPVIRFTMNTAPLPVVCNVPTNLSSTSITTNSATIAWSAPSTAPALGYETIISTSATTPVVAGTATASLSRNITGLNSNTLYYFFVRSKCDATNYSAYVRSEFTTTCSPPAITSTNSTIVCNNGTATLTAVASAGTISWYNTATGGTSIASGNTFVTPIITTTTTYYAAVNNGTCINPVRTAVAATVNPGVAYYADVDSDGYGAGTAVFLCEATEGYVLNNDDCNDTNTSINPSAAEIFFNGIDDNCDGNIDEGNQIVTQIRANQCGTTISNIYSILFADVIADATAYRFKVITLNDPTNIQYFESVVPSFRITDLADYAYGHTYRVSVEVQLSGVWLGYYGAECRVSTPILSNGIAQCGATIDIFKGINAGVVQGVTGYRFRVTNMTNPNHPNAVQVIDRTVSWFQLTSLDSYEYNTTYSVEVAVKTTGLYSNYSTPCNISTKPWSALPLTIRQCGITYTNIYSPINASVIPNVSGYRFRFTNIATNDVQVITQTLSYTNLAALTTYTSGATYSVEVAVRTTGDFGDFGPACSINAPAAVIAANQTTSIATNFKVVAYPNPFSETFVLHINDAAKGNTEIKVYDMIGKLLQTRLVQATDVSSQHFGTSMPAGVYNVIVTQGDAVETLRVIKR